MQDALFEPTIGNAKDILVLRAFVTHTHLVRPQHHQCELAGCVVHVSVPPTLLTAMWVGDVKVGLTPTARHSASAQSFPGQRHGLLLSRYLGARGASTLGAVCGLTAHGGNARRLLAAERAKRLVGTSLAGGHRLASMPSILRQAASWT
jgi:hypothetical protein